MDEGAFQLECTTANLAGIEAQFLAKADGRKAVTWGAQNYTKELAVFERRVRIHLEACERLQCRAANQLCKALRKGMLGAEEIKSCEYAVDAVDYADLSGLRLEGLEKAFDVIRPAVEAVAKSASWRRCVERKKRLADAIPDGTLVGRTRPTLLEVLRDCRSLAIADLLFSTRPAAANPRRE